MLGLWNQLFVVVILASVLISIDDAEGLHYFCNWCRYRTLLAFDKPNVSERPSESKNYIVWGFFPFCRVSPEELVLGEEPNSESKT